MISTETQPKNKMKTQKIALKEVGAFSSMFLDYLEGNESLLPFYNSAPTIEEFQKVIENRSFDTEKRLALYDVLIQEYNRLEMSPLVEQNIFSLQDEKTFTVTTGHQLNIFTGPLYFIFKIVTTINLARKLKEAYPDYNFVPVYWMASEDHDFEEIRSFNLFGKKYTWETAQTGAVGRFAPQSLNVVLEQLSESLEIFERAYLDSSTLAEAVRVYCNELFGEEGLVVLDADDKRLKSIFAEIIKDDVTERKAHQLVQQTNDRLNELGYKSQAFAREINFFFLNGFRDRIVGEDGLYRVNNHDLKFTPEEIIETIAGSPEKFSPNVIMRPLYQEVVLPNLAYIGGPAELIYWLQLKGVFDHYQVPYPILMPRNFGMVINKGMVKKLDKIGCRPEDLFKDAHQLKAEFLERQGSNEHLLDHEKVGLAEVFEKIKIKAGSIDKSLEGFIGAESSKALKGLENVEKRLKKAQETQNDTIMKQIDSVKEKLFPGDGLQERHDNFLNFYLNNPDFIKNLIDEFDPFDFSFYQFWEE